MQVYCWWHVCDLLHWSCDKYSKCWERGGGAYVLILRSRVQTVQTLCTYYTIITHVHKNTCYQKLVNEGLKKESFYKGMHQPHSWAKAPTALGRTVVGLLYNPPACPNPDSHPHSSKKEFLQWRRNNWQSWLEITALTCAVNLISFAKTLKSKTIELVVHPSVLGLSWLFTRVLVLEEIMICCHTSPPDFRQAVPHTGCQTPNPHIQQAVPNQLHHPVLPHSAPHSHFSILLQHY